MKIESNNSKAKPVMRRNITQLDLKSGGTMSPYVPNAALVQTTKHHHPSKLLKHTRIGTGLFSNSATNVL